MKFSQAIIAIALGFTFTSAQAVSWNVFKEKVVPVEVKAPVSQEVVAKDTESTSDYISRVTRSNNFEKETTYGIKGVSPETIGFKNCSIVARFKNSVSIVPLSAVQYISMRKDEKLVNENITAITVSLIRSYESVKIANFNTERFEEEFMHRQEYCRRLR